MLQVTSANPAMQLNSQQYRSGREHKIPFVF
jgi:hypothetical protein